MAVHFLADQADLSKIGEEALASLAQAYSTFIPEQEVYVEYSFVDKEKIRQINAEQRQIDKPTDVLSFPLYSAKDLAGFTSSPEPILLGSIMICPEITLYYEESLLQVLHHGLLHLYGYDHEEDPTAWDNRERSVLKELTELGYVIQPLGDAEI